MHAICIRSFYAKAYPSGGTKRRTVGPHLRAQTRWAAYLCERLEFSSTTTLEHAWLQIVSMQGSKLLDDGNDQLSIVDDNLPGDCVPSQEGQAPRACPSHQALHSGPCLDHRAFLKAPISRAKSHCSWSSYGTLEPRSCGDHTNGQDNSEKHVHL